MNPGDPNAPRGPYQPPPQGHYPPPQQGPYRPAPVYYPPPRSGLAIGAFAVALVGFILGIIPFVGIVGTIGLVMGLVDKNSNDPPDRPRRHGLATAAIVLGSLATAGVGIWTLLLVVVSRASSSRGSCPHVYSFDGERYRLDADPVSGALFAGAERDDVDRLESLRAVDGEYRVRVANDLEETDHIDSLALVVADAPADVEVLPTQANRLVGVRGAVTPLSAVDSSGRDVLDLVAAEDGRVVVAGDHGARSATGDPRETWTLEFERPATARALLVVRGHNTQFAETAFVSYLATMGQGIRPLLEWGGGQGDDCYQDYLSAEIDRLGLPMWVTVASGGATGTRATLQPVGPAISRSQALPIVLPGGDGRLVVRLEATPRFWEIDQVQLAPDDAPPIESRALWASSATTSSGTDVRDAIASTDRRRVVIRPGEHVDVRFTEPPSAVPGLHRTVLAQLRGYYALDIGGRHGVDPLRVLAHRMGLRSLPRFAAGLR